MLQPLLLSQRDARWSNTLLGFSKSSTIGQYGCTITCLAMRFRLTPDTVNTILKAYNGFRDALIYWPAINEAFPGVKFIYRYKDYSDQYNAIIEKNIPCLFEVDAAPIGGKGAHWVLYVGNGKIYDPWDGREKTITTYKITGLTLLEGEYTSGKEVETPKVVETPKADIVVKKEDRFYGLDPKNEDTFAALAKYWHEGVKEGKLISIDDHNRIMNAAISKQGSVTSDASEEVKRYREFVALGYTTVVDLQNEITKFKKTITDLLKDIVIVERRNYELANLMAEDSKNTYTAVETAITEIDEKKELEESLAEIAKVAETKPETNAIVNKFINTREMADRYMEQKEKAAQTFSNLTQVKTDGLKFFTNLFKTKEVK